VQSLGLSKAIAMMKKKVIRLQASRTHYPGTFHGCLGLQVGALNAGGKVKTLSTTCPAHFTALGRTNPSIEQRNIQNYHTSFHANYIDHSGLFPWPVDSNRAEDGFRTVFLGFPRNDSFFRDAQPSTTQAS
jgi:hypothetical protein